MRDENFKPLKKRPTLPALLMVSALILGAALAAGKTRAQEEPPPFSCPDLDAKELYAHLKQEALAHQTYVATFARVSEGGKNHEIWARMRVAGKYMQSPARYFEKRLELESSFPEQAGAGFQQVYTASDDMSRLLMPGPLRMLGVIPLYPEDPKAYYLNGENLKEAAVWDWIESWDRMLEYSTLSARCEERNGVEHYVLVIDRGKNPDPVYRHQEVRIWVDPGLMFPMLVEYFVPDDQKPVLVFEFEQAAWDAPLTEGDMAFEGFNPKWQLISLPKGPRIEKMTRVEPGLEPAELDPAAFLAALDQALAGVTEYETEMTLKLRYLRLRQYKEDRFRFFRDSRAFSMETRALEANYLMLPGNEGSRMAFDPSRDPMIHVRPGGVYGVVGEQTFPPDDPRLFSALGDNITDLDFFAIRDELSKRADLAVSKRTAQASYEDLRGPWIEVKEKTVGIPERPTVMRLLLDPDSRLPRCLEYLGYGDPQAFMVVLFNNTRVNEGD